MTPRRRFRFIREIAAGGFGKVYVAEMITTDNFSSVVAIKLLHGKWTTHEEIAQRARDEARLLGRLRHRNIVRVEDLTSIRGQAAVVMEYLEGVDLKSFIHDLAEKGELLPVTTVFEIVAQVASALDAAYNHVPLQGGEPLRLIHRDIKPSNVMVTIGGDVKLLDFGTARANFEDREAKTQALAFGSQAYMAPERLLGDPDTPAGDIFSLGVTTYELLSGGSYGKIHIRPERYERARDKRVDALDLSAQPPAIQDRVRELLRSMLAYEPEDRPTHTEIIDAAELMTDEADGSGLRRYARQRVRDVMLADPHVPDDDELAGSTLFEDRSSTFDTEGLPSDVTIPPPDDDFVPPPPPPVSDGAPAAAERKLPQALEPARTFYPGDVSDIEALAEEVVAATRQPTQAPPGLSPVVDLASVVGRSDEFAEDPTVLERAPEGLVAPADHPARAGQPAGGRAPFLEAVPVSPGEWDDNPETVGVPGPKVGGAPATPPPVVKPVVKPVAEPPVVKPVAAPPVAGPPVAGPPVAGPPVAGPPVAGPPVAGPPVVGEPSAGRGKLVAVLLVVVILGMLGGGVVLFGGDDGEPPVNDPTTPAGQTNPPPVEPPPADPPPADPPPADPVVEVAPVTTPVTAPKDPPPADPKVSPPPTDPPPADAPSAADAGGLRLMILPIGGASLSLNNAVGYKHDWDGSGARLDLSGLDKGTYRTKVSPKEGGSSTRGMVSVEPGKTCTYRININDEAPRWEARGCE